MLLGRLASGHAEPKSKILRLQARQHQQTSNQADYWSGPGYSEAHSGLYHGGLRRAEARLHIPVLQLVPRRTPSTWEKQDPSGATHRWIIRTTEAILWEKQASNQWSVQMVDVRERMQIRTQMHVQTQLRSLPKGSLAPPHHL